MFDEEHPNTVPPEQIEAVLKESVAALRNEIRLTIKEVEEHTKQGDRHHEGFRTETVKLINLLGRLRRCFPSDDTAFGRALIDSGVNKKNINPNHRMALIAMFNHAEIALPIIATTDRRSWFLIWEHEVKPILSGKIDAIDGEAEAIEKPKRKGKAKKKKVDDDERPDDAKAQELCRQAAKAFKKSYDRLSDEMKADAIRDWLDIVEISLQDLESIFGHETRH